VDEGAPVGPSAAEEATLLATETPVAAPEWPEVAPGADNDRDLPPLEDLVKRIPPKTRAAMDEFFRANFVTVKRVPISDKG
jgi:hypothetical protein